MTNEIPWWAVATRLRHATESGKYIRFWVDIVCGVPRAMWLRKFLGYGRLRAGALRVQGPEIEDLLRRAGAPEILAGAAGELARKLQEQPGVALEETDLTERREMLEEFERLYVKFLREALPQADGETIED